MRCSATARAALSAKMPAFGHGRAGDVADGVDVWEARREVRLVDGDPAVLGEAGLPRRPRARGAPGCRGTGRTASACRRGGVRVFVAGSMRRHALVAAPTRCCARGSGRGWRRTPGPGAGMGMPHGETTLISMSGAHAALGEVFVEEHRGLARRGRALEGLARTATITLAARERRAGRRAARARRRRSRTRAPPSDEPRRRTEVVVGAERDDEHVGVVGAAVRDDATRGRVDRRDRAPAGTSRPAWRSSRSCELTPSRLARPNMSSNFEKPKTNAVVLVDERDVRCRRRTPRRGARRARGHRSRRRG